MYYTYTINTKLKIIRSLGETDCTNCGHHVTAQLAAEKQTGKLLGLIPIMSFTTQRIKFCPICGIMETLPKKEFKRLKTGA